MDLFCKKKTIMEVDYSDIEKFISYHYGFNFDLHRDQVDLNCNVRFITLSKENMGIGCKMSLEAYKETGKGVYMFSTLMRDLCNRDLIEEGEYIILLGA
ncbi:MAG: hypothetical protein DRR06_17615, partial [Gammaproteobacteria bacterium]